MSVERRKCLHTEVRSYSKQSVGTASPTENSWQCALFSHNVIVDQIKKEMENFKGMPQGVKIDYTGELEEQGKQMAFLIGAFFTGLGLIMLILIFQFGGISKPFSAYNSNALLELSESFVITRTSSLSSSIKSTSGASGPLGNTKQLSNNA